MGTVKRALNHRTIWLIGHKLALPARFLRPWHAHASQLHALAAAARAYRGGRHGVVGEDQPVPAGLPPGGGMFGGGVECGASEG